MVTLVKTKTEFDSTLSNNTLVAVDFTASWCGPCKMIGPKFEAMAAQFPSIKFIKVDVDENSETSEALGIAAMPTFFFYANGEKMKEVVGASEDKLREALQELSA
ncbi:thioredoxin-like [Clytia hemisphaerica]|uniref:Thioredoxin n=1 Tax=Clytia hemisphaerica TaxID=252671 RepID=A0A7M5XH29_9CNID